MNLECQRECSVKTSMIHEELNKTISRLERLENKNGEMDKLSKLLELQMESDKEQNKVLHDLSLTIVKVNENLTSLNSNYKNLNDRVGSVEKDLQDNKIDDLRREKQRVREGSVSFNDVIKKVIFGLAAATGGAILIWLGVK